MVSKIWWRLVRFGFRLLYNELAFTYDLVSYIVSLGDWRCWQRSALTYLPESREGLVLELAHGTGNLQIDLHAEGYRTIGYDLSSAMGRIARNKLKDRGIPARLVRGKAQQLPFPNGQFCAVITTFPTDFITWSDTLHEIHRVLEANGQLIIVPTATLTGSGVFARFLEWFYQITGQGDEAGWGIAPFFEEYHFKARVSEHECQHSRVHVIVAQKMG